MMTRTATRTLLLMASSAFIGCSSDGASGTLLAPSIDPSLGVGVAGCTRPAPSLPDQLTPLNKRSIRLKRSETFSESVSIQFTNATCMTVSVYWIDYSGNRVLYAVLPSGQSYIQQTFVSHPWIVAGPGGDRVGFTPKSGIPLAEAYIGDQ